MAESLEDIEKIEKIEQEAEDRISHLVSMVDDASLSEIRHIITEIRNTKADLPPQSRSTHFAEEAAAAEAKAEEKKREEEAKATEQTSEFLAAAVSGLLAASTTEKLFSQQMFQYMAATEQQFFNNLSGPQTLVMLDQNGQVQLDENGKPRLEKVDGSLLQADFALIKFHTLDKPQQTGFISEFTEKHGVNPVDSQDSERLHNALHRLEGLHIKRTLEAHPNMTLEEARKSSHELFARAHEQVDSTVSLEGTARTLDANALSLRLAAKNDPSLEASAKTLEMNAKVAGLAAKYHEDKLGADFQNILDSVSGNTPRQREHEQGIAINVTSTHIPMANLPNQRNQSTLEV